jgi:hypothetical protein
MNFGQHPIVDTIAIYVALGLVGTMPPKGVKWSAETLYDWFYDFAHVVINFIPASRRPATESAPTQPTGSAQR